MADSHSDIAVLARQMRRSGGADFEVLDARMLTNLRNMHKTSLDQILRIAMSHELTIVRPTDLYKSERHLFPILEVARALGADEWLTEQYCVAFLIGYSLPVLAINYWIDQRGVAQGLTAGRMVGSIFDAVSLLASISASSKCIHTINSIYNSCVQSVVAESSTRFVIPDDARRISIIASVQDVGSGSFYRSHCAYLSAGIHGFLELLGIDSSPFRSITYAFGVIRQLADELIDLQEDVEHGLLTLPLIRVLDRDLELLVSEVWSKRCAPESAIGVPRVRDGIEYTLRIIDAWQDYSDHELRTLESAGHSFVGSLRPFFDWKAAYVNRLRLGGVTDHISNYRHLPRSEAIEAALASTASYHARS